MKLDPFAQLSKAFEAWQKFAEDSFSRTQAFYAEVDKLEAKNAERAESAVQEMARLTKETLAYGAQMGSEWRKLSLESMQRASEAFAAAGDAAR
jgi:hypothetical protein